MAYDSPKTIRNRQQRANDKAACRLRPTQTIKPLTDEEWGHVCNYHLSNINGLVKANLANTAGRHAAALVHMAIQRRAQQIMRDHRRAYWKAMAMARRELYNCEI